MFRVGVFVFFFFISAVWQSQTNLPTHFLNFLWDGSDFFMIRLFDHVPTSIHGPLRVLNSSTI